MYNGIGLQTPRGSGTNSYIQGNKFFVKPKSGKVVVDNKCFAAGQGTALTKKPNKEILEHDRKRQIELKLVILEDKLADQGYTDAEIADNLAEARRNLESTATAEEAAGGAAPLLFGDKKFSDTQTHQIAARKERHMETLRAALGIGTSEANSQKKKNGQELNSGECGDDELIDGWTKGLNDDSKLHKNDAKAEKEDLAIRKNDGGRDRIDELKSHKNQESKETRRGGGSSDTDSDGNNVKGIRKKHQKANHQSDSENGSDIDTRKKRQKSTLKDKKNRRDYHSDSDHYGGKYEKTHKKHDKKSRRHDSDDSESNDERSSKRHDRKHRRLDRNDSSSDDEKYKQTHKRHDTDDDDSSFDEGSKHKTQRESSM
ncbi:uncharacterized protein LOC130789034 [Actinidia eriantha]|uniref:uncharacterized protein LOC130789034 n=1 Tax=Actinidia eriantha TaxID=165200 RepID=UPI00258C6CDB|nr:uncharacterized protein LOC130789034 [Actinidia eriantha]